MFAGIVIRKDEILWGTFVSGHLHSFPSRIAGIPSYHILSSPDTAERLIADIKQDIESRTSQALSCMVLAVTAPGIRERAALDRAVAGCGCCGRVLNMSHAAAFGWNLQSNGDEDILCACSDADRYEACVAFLDGGACEILTSARRGTGNPAAEDQVSMIGELLEYEGNKAPVLRVVAPNLSAPALRELQKQRSAITEPYNPSLPLYGAAANAACLAGDSQVGNVLLLDTLDWDILGNTTVMIGQGATVPNTSKEFSIPARTLTKEGLKISLCLKTAGKEDETVSFRLPARLPGLLPAKHYQKIHCSVDNSRRLSFCLTDPGTGQQKTYSWPEIREMILSS